MENRGLIGVQMMMLKEKVQELGAFKVLRRLAQMGFHCIEISQIPMTAENVAEIRRACDEFGIRVAACSAALDSSPMGGESLSTDFDKIVSDCKALNCDLLRIGMLPIPLMGSREKALDFVRRAEECAARLQEHGIALYYHNHHIEFTKYDGETLLEIIRQNTRLLGFELDVHWIQRGGADPLEVIRRFSGRVRLLHLKDYRVTPFQMPEGGFARDGFMNAFTNNIQFAELGQGTLPIDRIVRAGLESGSEYFLIEQDDTYGRDPFDCLQTSMDHLKQLGFAGWFDLPGSDA
ncbi:MAG: sugar phosphate isomerase/epimerase family protein [Acutalibacteraceae bacterium]|jgi:sugar phosphate isomerase/epimerase